MAARSPSLNILLIEDHPVLRGLLRDTLRDAGHTVVTMSCAEEMEELGGGQPADIFLVDINLPGEDGFSLTQRLRAAYPTAAIVIITARSGLEDKCEGYALGADLYLPKPFEAEELCAIVEALGRRKQRLEHLLNPADQQELLAHQQQLSLSLAGSATPQVALTSTELAILTALSRAPAQRLASWQLAELLGLDLDNYAKSNLEVRMVRLRKKIAQAGVTGKSIVVVRGFGYQLLLNIRVL